MGAGVDEAGQFITIVPNNRVRPVAPAGKAPAENERVGSGHTFQAAYSRAGNTSVRTVIVPWATYPRQIQAILGYTVAVTEGEGYLLNRFLPWRDPVDHGLFAQSVSVRGISPDGFGEWVPTAPPETTPRWPMQTHSRFLWAELTITFGTINFRLAENIGDMVASVNPTLGTVLGRAPSQDPDPAQKLDGAREQLRYCIKEVREAREFVHALPGTFVRAINGENPPVLVGGMAPVTSEIKYPIPAVVPYADITVVWLQIPYEAVPFRAISRAAGRVNDTTFELPSRPPGRFYGPETLLLQTYAIQDHYMPGTEINGGSNVTVESERVCDVVYYFRWRGRLKANGDPDTDVFAPNWNKMPLPSQDANHQLISPFTRVFRKPTNGGYILDSRKNASKPLGLYDVFRFDYLFRPDRPPRDGDPF